MNALISFAITFIGAFIAVNRRHYETYRRELARPD